MEFTIIDMQGYNIVPALVWLWVSFYPELLVPEIWFLRLAGIDNFGETV